jgi:hypothetical protein
MKLSSCYLEHLDSLGLRHANRLNSKVGGYILYSRVGHGKQYGPCALHAGQLRPHTLKISNIYCFSIATMVARTRLIVTLHVDCLSLL